MCDNGFGNPDKPLSTLRGEARWGGRGLLGTRWRWRLRTTVTAGTARPHARAPRTAPRRTTGTATRGERTSGEHHPRRPVGTRRPDWPVGTERPMVGGAIGLAVLGELAAAEK